jgi:hypothetical protein
MPLYLTAAVAVLGLLVYLSTLIGPIFKISSSEFPSVGGGSTGTTIGVGLGVIAALFAALLAGVSLVPKQSKYSALVAVLAVIGFLLVIAEVINKPNGVSLGWALYLVLAFSFLEAAAAVLVLLIDAGLWTPPAPRPKYDQFQQQPYGPPGQYYGQPGQLPGQPQHTPPPQQNYGQQQNFGQQRPGYPQYGGYPSGPPGSAPSGPPGSAQSGPPGSSAPTAVFSQSQALGQQAGPPTPPTGFPTYGQPPSAAAPTQMAPTPQPESEAQAQPDSNSAQSGPPPS